MQFSVYCIEIGSGANRKKRKRERIQIVAVDFILLEHKIAFFSRPNRSVWSMFENIEKVFFLFRDSALFRNAYFRWNEWGAETRAAEIKLDETRFGSSGIPIDFIMRILY